MTMLFQKTRAHTHTHTHTRTPTNTCDSVTGSGRKAHLHLERWDTLGQEVEGMWPRLGDRAEASWCREEGGLQGAAACAGRPRERLAWVSCGAQLAQGRPPGCFCLFMLKETQVSSPGG